MDYKQWFEKNKKTLKSLKRSFEREMKTKISLQRFSENMYKETKNYKKTGGKENEL